MPFLVYGIRKTVSSPGEKVGLLTYTTQRWTLDGLKTNWAKNTGPVEENKHYLCEVYQIMKV